MQHTLEVRQLEISGCNERMFIPFFSIDSDFEENQEYFRPDTLELGFENESERCSKELYDKYKDQFYIDGYEETLSAALEEAANYCIEGGQHYIGNDTYTSDYNITLICTDDHHNDYIVVVSSMSKC